MHIANEIRQPIDATHIAHLLFPLFQSVHRANGRVARLIGGKAIGDAFLDLVLQVELQLLIELPLDLATAQNGPQTQGCREPPVLDPHNASYVSESWMTCEMAVDSRRQFAASDSSCFLPRRVSE